MGDNEYAEDDLIKIDQCKTSALHERRGDPDPER